MTETVPARSEVTFDVNGGTRGLRFDFNAIVEVEESLNGKAFGQVAAALAAGLTSFRELRVLAKVGMCTWADEHDEKKKRVNLPEAGRIIQELGMKQFVELLQLAFTAAFPDMTGEEDEDEGDDEEK